MAGSYTGPPATVALDGKGLAPGALVLSNPTLDFGSITEGTLSAAQQVVVTNSGGVAVKLTAASVSSGYQVSTDCGASLAPKATCLLQVIFAPTATGVLPGLLTVPGDIAGGSVTAALNGMGVTPGALILTPVSLSFAQATIGIPSPAQSLTLSNPGGTSLTLQAPILTPGYTLVPGNCGSSLDANATCTFGISFTPLVPGNTPGVLTIASTSGTAQAQATLSGIAVAPAHLVFSPAAISFGSLQEYTTSAVQSTTLTNDGGLAVILNPLVLTGDYSIATNHCGTTLGAGNSCTVSLTLHPLAVGDRPGLLSVTSTDNALSAAATLDGTSIAPPALFLDPTALDFGSLRVGLTSVLPQNITVSNTGATIMQLQLPTVTGDFLILANTCILPLKPLFGCTVSVLFAPLLGGVRTGTFTISDGTETRSATLTGNGLSAPTDTLSTASLTFAPQVVGSVSPLQNVTLTNSGQATLGSLAAVTAAPFTVTNNCGPSLGGGLSCSIAVSYVPTATGPQTGLLTITDALNHPQTVTLSGTGVAPPRAFASPISLNFGSYAIGIASPVQTVTFTNNGTSPMTGVAVAIGGDPSFLLVSSTCGTSLAAGQSCQAFISFKPQQAANLSSQLTLTSPSLSAPLSVSLAGAGEDFELSVTGPSTAVLTPGQTARYQLLVTPVGSSRGPLAFSCSGAPLNATCSVSPTGFTLAGGATGSVVVSVVTGGGVTVLPGSRKAPHDRHGVPSATPAGPQGSAAAGTSGFAPLSWRTGALLAMLLPFAFRKKLRRVWVLLLVALALTMAPIGCGVHASGGSSASSGAAAGTTPAGTYVILATASFPGATRTATLTLVVQ